MRLAAIPIPFLLAFTGSAYLGAILVLIVSRTPLGSLLFSVVAGVAGLAYGATLARVWTETRVSHRAFMAALGLALLFRLPAAVAPVGPDSDMVRYLWDGRVQRYGYNPYEVVPADPALAHTHTAQTSAMPSRRHRTPYPPAAQLFFRLVVTLADSTLAMKLALVCCDVLTIVVIRRWLALTGRNEWLTLAYAWHPLVVLEVAHSGHIDTLGALWIAAAAWWLTRRRTALATIAFVLAVATKLLPIVLAPLLIGRVRARDAVLGLTLLAALYLPFGSGADLPLGSVPNVVANIRFNSPVFAATAWLASPRAAAALAVLLGLGAGLLARFRWPETEPAAWAWPMALALVAAPVIYPWYLLSFTPFLLSRATLPITVWTFSVMPVYLVWRVARDGGRWIVPSPVLVVEYGSFLAAALFVAAVSIRAHRRSSDQSPVLRST